MRSNLVRQLRKAENPPVRDSGLPVRTNLRAGLAWDDLDDQAKALWSKLSSTITNAANQVTSSTTSSTT